MNRILLKVSLFKSEADRKRSENYLLKLLEIGTQLNEGYLKMYPSPSLYESGVRYRTELKEEWKDIENLLHDGYGDCEDLSMWRCAELRNQGINTKPYIRFRRNGPMLRYHVLVQYSDGRLEDPSRKLGMGAE